MDPTVTFATIISAIALLSSIFSPMVVTLLNNRHQRKIAEFEFYARHRAEAIENYLSAAGAAVQSLSHETLRNYGKHAGEIYFHIPSCLWHLVDQITVTLEKGDLKKAKEHLRTLSKELAENPPRGKKHHCRNRNVQK